MGKMDKEERVESKVSDMETETETEMDMSKGTDTYTDTDMDTVDPKPVNESLDKPSPSTSGTEHGLSAAANSVTSEAGGGGDDDGDDDGDGGGEKRSLSFSKVRRASDDDSETYSENSDESRDDDMPWIPWFCNLRGNEFFTMVDEEYLLDNFNLYGLSKHFPYYGPALEMILGVKFTYGEMFSDEHNERVKITAPMLYGMIHARYILTGRGLLSMLEKYENAEFGRCPRVNCGVQPCLPLGQSDRPRRSAVKIYCPKCEDVYSPLSKYQSYVDGAFFGTTFPNLFFMAYPFLKPEKPSLSYTPKVFGFNIHKT